MPPRIEKNQITSPLGVEIMAWGFSPRRGGGGYLGSVSEEFPRGAEADAVCPAGDERDFTLDAHDRSEPVSRRFVSQQVTTRRARARPRQSNISWQPADEIREIENQSYQGIKCPSRWYIPDRGITWPRIALVNRIELYADEKIRRHVYFCRSIELPRSVSNLSRCLQPARGRANGSERYCNTRETFIKSIRYYTL